jgi:ribosome-interacting GTPase 1
MKVEQEVTVSDIADALMGETDEIANLLILLASDLGEQSAKVVAEAIRDKLYVPDDRRGKLRLLAEALVSACDMP